jgi:HSP20 family protein
MLMTRWQPFFGGAVSEFQNEMNRHLERFGVDDLNRPALGFAYPAVNVWEDDDNIYAEAELPGMDQNQLEIYVMEGNQLTISGERKPVEELKGTWHRQERGFGKFKRTITLPVPIDPNKVEAHFQQGVLFLTLPKCEIAKPRRISVKAE